MTWVSIALVSLLPAGGAFRVKTGAQNKADDHESDIDSGNKYCCCMNGACNRNTTSSKLYWPEENLCCKSRSSNCGPSFFNPTAFTAYTLPKANTWCQPKPTKNAKLRWSLPDAEPLDVSKLKEGGVPHILHTHCKKSAESEEGGPNTETNAILSQLTQELAANNLQSMTREIFTMYTCVRWAPDASYVHMANDELDNNQLPVRESAGDNKRLQTARAVERGNFIPLRCSQNIGVYDLEKTTEAGPQHYPEFERRMRAMASFFKTEQGKAFDMRARKLEQMRWLDPFSPRAQKQKRWESLLQRSDLFNHEVVKQKANECAGNTAPMEVSSYDSDESELLQDCAFVLWWAPKLADWKSRFPFQAFLAGNEKSKLEPGQRVLVCFGKRVSGELHRRKAGSHILTDMNGVGCHGFWDFKETSEMLTRIVDLWAPPTCQLTTLELKMKSRLLEMFATMNKNLFEALPSMVASESFNDDNPSAEESQGLEKISAGGQWVYNWMSSTRQKYTNLGQIMSSSVMKWSVCPIGVEDGLDGRLGSDDLLTQKMTEKAYQYWTKQEILLPGEECEKTEMASWASGLPGGAKCRLGVLRENYPEAYNGTEFACPALPLMPAGQQLRILSKKHTDSCLVMATPEQVLAADWPYRGLRPAEVQYQPRGFEPAKSYELVQVLDRRNSLDKFGISRDYVTLARVCTIEVWEKYPRWCEPPVFMNEASLSDKVLGAAASVVSGAAGAATGLMNQWEHNDKSSWQTWFSRQFLELGNGLLNSLRTSQALIKTYGPSVVARMERIKTQRIYSSVEAGEALWGASFQEEEGGGGSRKQFARYAATMPCTGIDVPKQIESEFAWGQAALELLHKVTGDFPSMLQEPKLSMAARSEVLILPGTHLRRTQQIAMRPGTDDTQWSGTKDTLYYLEEAMKMSTLTTLDGNLPETYGFQMQLVCGRRDQIYGSVGSMDTFLSCVQAGASQARKREEADGKEANTIEQLREELEQAQEELDEIADKADDAGENEQDHLRAKADKQRAFLVEKEAALSKLLRGRPLTLDEYDSEIVVRVDFAPISPAVCLVFKDPSMDKLLSTPSPENENPDAYQIEKNLQFAKAVAKKTSVCSNTPAATPYHGSAPEAGSILTAYKGGDVPPLTRKEVILSPLDVLLWLD